MASASPKYCSLDVKELASDSGWTELPTHPQDEDRMMSFFSGKHEGVTVNVNLDTGTVATSLEHPSKGKTQLYRGQRSTLGQLEEVFNNPRVHTGSAYKTRAKLREAVEEEGVSRGISLGEDGCYEFEETTSIQYDLLHELSDIENLRIEENDGSCDSEDNEMTNLLTQGRLMFESGSESDGELPLNKLLGEWDEEEIESEEVSASEDYDHLKDSEFSSSSGESDKGIENCILEKDSLDSGDSSFLNETGDSEFYQDDESDTSSSEFDSPVTENGNDSYDDTDEDSDDFNDF